MKNKILVLGCSYSAGYYEEIEPKVERVRHSSCWYHYIDIFKEYQIDVISTPGLGIISQIQILNVLYKNNFLNDYRYIIIQETLEPRICFSSDTDLLFHYKKNNFNVETESSKVNLLHYHRQENSTFKNYSMFFSPHHYDEIDIERNIHSCYLYKLSKEQQNFFLKMFIDNSLLFATDDDEHNIYVKTAHNLLDNIISKINARCFLFSMKMRYYFGNVCEHLNIDNVVETLSNNGLLNEIVYMSGGLFKDKKELIQGHQTKKGNIFIGNLLNEELKKLL